MALLISIVAGALVGVVLGRVRVPRSDWISFLSLAVVVVGCWWAIVVSFDVGAWEALAFVVVSQISASLYAAWLWQRSGVIAPSFLRLVWWSFWRPGYVEELHAHELEPGVDQGSTISTSH